MTLTRFASFTLPSVVLGSLVTVGGAYAYQGFGPPTKPLVQGSDRSSGEALGHAPPVFGTTGPANPEPNPAAHPIKGGSPEGVATGAGGSPFDGGGFGGGMGGGMMMGMGGGRMSQYGPGGRRPLLNSIAIDGPRVAAEDKSPRTKVILEVLERPTNMNFPNPTPLKDVLKYVKSATRGPKDTGIPIYVDPTGFVGGDSEKSTVTLDLDGVPLKTSLRLLLKQLDMAYCVRDGLLIISSIPNIAEELSEAAAAFDAAEGKTTRSPSGVQ